MWNCKTARAFWIWIAAEYSLLSSHSCPSLLEMGSLWGQMDNLQASRHVEPDQTERHLMNCLLQSTLEKFQLID